MEASPKPNGVLAAIEERVPIGKALRSFLHESIPGGARWAYVFGSMCLALIALQAITGIVIAAYYVPSPDHALTTLEYVEKEVPFGRVLLGVHHWGANILVGLVLVHVAQAFVFGAYKRPREAVWLSGVVLLLLVQAFHFTGYALPWDQEGYWATEVGTALARNTPFIGEWVMRMMRGGPEVGAVTLTHFFAIHVMVLPAIVGGAILLHLVFLRLVGPAGSFRTANEAPRREHTGFFPHQVFKDAVAITLLVAMVVGLAAWQYHPHRALANPSDTSFLPRPEWNFLFLFQIQKLFPGSLEWLAALVVPALLVGMVAAVPFVDRSETRDPRRRAGVLVAGFAVAFGVVALTGMAVASDKATVAWIKDPDVRAGEKLYQANECLTCHKLRGDGAGSGPDLSFIGANRTSERIRQYIKDPDSLYEDTSMPPYKRLTDRELDQVTKYLVSMK